MSPQRIQLSRAKGWRKPEGAVVVSRPTKWGNPYRWQDQPRWPSPYLGSGDLDDDPSPIPDSTRRRWAVLDLEALVKGWLTTIGPRPAYPTVEEIRRELAGRDLACWCPPGQPCHADLLLVIAAQGDKCQPH